VGTQGLGILQFYILTLCFIVLLVGPSHCTFQEQNGQIGAVVNQHQCINWPSCPWDGLHFFIQPPISQVFLVFNLWVLFQACFFLNSDLHTTFSPHYPTDLATLLAYILALPTNKQPTSPTYLPTYLFFFSYWLNFYISTKTFYFQVPSYTLVFCETSLLSS